MTMRSAAKKRYEMCRALSALRGGPAAGYFLDASRCSDVHGASPENYFVLRFFSLSEKQRREFLTSGRSKRADAALNAGASAADRAALADKGRFDQVFSPFIGREHICPAKADYEEFRAFLEKHGEIFLKPRRGTQGQGARRISVQSIISPRGFYSECAAQDALLEELIIQHPALSAINPGCVNSLRINAARNRGGDVVLIGAALRCGAPGACADNFHSGGVAYPLDLESGAVSGPGRDGSTLEDYVRHPGTHLFMPGLKIPFWEEALDLVSRAMDTVPTMGYVGWDLAVTPGGPQLIEGNFGYPGGNIIQFDGVGKYPLILSCMGESHGKQTY